MVSWNPAEVPDLSGQTALITGANGGIGFEAALAFARAGAHVVLACRDAARGQAATSQIQAASPAGRAELLLLDLARLSSVRQAAAEFATRHSRLDLLVNNAGLMALPRTLTEDGFELHLGVNHFAHFALTGLLLPQLLASPSARVVTVSSLLHHYGWMRFDDLDGARRYFKWHAYAQSKLANALFGYELQRRLARKGAPVISLLCHPGYAATNLPMVAPTTTGSALGLVTHRFMRRWFAQSAEQGAWPTVYAATKPGLRGGEFIGPQGWLENAGPPVPVKPSAGAQDLESARRLWQVSIERTGVTYAELA